MMRIYAAMAQKGAGTINERTKAALAAARARRAAIGAVGPEPDYRCELAPIRDPGAARTNRLKYDGADVEAGVSMGADRESNPNEIPAAAV